jgi:hypothetical protein
LEDYFRVICIDKGRGFGSGMDVAYPQGHQSKGLLRFVEQHTDFISDVYTRVAVRLIVKSTIMNFM